MQASGKRYIIHGSRSDVFTLWNLADLHWMSRACAESKVRADVKRIADDPNAFFLGGGDYVDFIGYSDKRFDPDAVAPWVSIKDLGNLGEVGMRQIRDLFAPIKHKCLGLLIGNHEKKYELHTEHEGLHGWLCTELVVPDREYCALFDVVFVRDPKQKRPVLRMAQPTGGNTRESFRVFAHHGAGYAQPPGGKLNRLIQFMNSFDATLYFAGHVHDQNARREPVIGADADCKNIVAKVRLGVVSGSYLKTYAQGTTTYGEQRGYRPTTLGAAGVQIRPETREIWAEV